MTWTKKRLNDLFFIIGVVAVVVMMLTFDVSFIELWEHLCHAGYWLIPILGVWIIIYGINGLAWREVMRGVMRSADDIEKYEKLPGFWRIFRLTVTGYALHATSRSSMLHHPSYSTP